MTTPLVGPAELAALPPGAVLIFDCRFDLGDTQAGRRAYRAGHLPGAFYVHLDEDLSGTIVPGQTGRHPLPAPRTFAVRMAELGLHPGRSVVVYDDKGGGIAARAWWLISQLGHRQVAVLDGGLSAWEAAGFWLTTEVPKPPITQVLPYPASKTDWPGTRGRAKVSSANLLIDSRTADRYRGEHEPIDPVAGHIPGAINLPWPDNLREGKFKSRKELRERFRELKQEPQQNVFYCGSGVTACHNILAYHYAYGGNRLPELYPGGWSEYLLGEER